MRNRKSLSIHTHQLNYSDLVNKRGFSVVELIIAAGIMSFIGLGVMQVIQDSDAIFTNSFRKLNNFFDESIFFKEMAKHVGKSKVIKGGIINCDGVDALSSDSDSYNNKVYRLRNRDDRLAFVFAESVTYGTFDGNAVFSYLEALTTLKELLAQKEIWDKMRSTVSDVEYENLEAQIERAEEDVDGFELSEDNFNLNILDSGRFQAKDRIIVSTIAGPNIAGIYRVNSVDTSAGTINLSHDDFPSSFTDCNTPSALNKTIEEIVVSAADLGAIASSSVILTKLRFVDYAAVQAKNPRNTLPDLLISFHDEEGVKEKARIPNLKSLEVRSSWTKTSSATAIQLSGKYRADINYVRLVKTTSERMVEEESNSTVYYDLNSSTRANFDIATSPRSSSPIPPKASGKVSDFYPGVVCGQSSFPNCNTVPQYAEQFFKVTARLTESTADVSFSVSAPGLECWGPLPKDPSTPSGGVAFNNTTGLYVFDKKSAKSGDVTLSKDFTDTSSRTFEANCHFARVDDNDWAGRGPADRPYNPNYDIHPRDFKEDFIGGFSAGDSPVKLTITMAYYDFNSGSMKNKAIQYPLIKPYFGEELSLQTGTGTCLTNGVIVDPLFTYADGNAPSMSSKAMGPTNGSCRTASGWEACAGITSGLIEVRWYPLVNTNSDPALEQYSVTCTTP